MLRIIAFTTALFFGVFSATLFKPADTATPCNNFNVHVQSKINSYSTENFDLSRNYTEAEAIALIGKKVRNVTALNAKCPKDAGNCLNLNIGEFGEVVGILPSLRNTFLIEIQWNDRLDDGYQHSGKFVTRAGKEVSFEILD